MVKMPSIFSLTSMPSATTVLSTYSIFAASAMLVRTVLSEIQTSHPDHTSKNPGENLVQDWKPSWQSLFSNYYHL
ncbi:hypothetical protein CK203_028511 [Vitis vinifera]|uniref:Uncharacterized protein n=1 Tax=Vitis vinifera TaxID=29760 RepID=A0A438I2B3_VITVI|nr:hypothetical protein CK203_028511 [Vitis vinifera]